MGIIRNCINVLGITPEEELPRGICGQLIETSETEHIHIKKSAKVKSIYQIIIGIKIKGTRIIDAPLNKIVVLDCLKTFKITYYNDEDKMGVLEYKSPFNCFIDIDNKEEEIEEVEINVVDAFFDMFNLHTLYSHILYIINVKYNSCRKCSVISKRKEAFSVIPYKRNYDSAASASSPTPTTALGSEWASTAESTSKLTDVDAVADEVVIVAATGARGSEHVATPTIADQYYEIVLHKEAIKEVGIATQNGPDKGNEFIDIEAEYL
jgi:hypothetical protein